MSNVLGLTIQSIKLDDNENINSKRNTLRRKEVNPCDLFVRRDGHLIRFSSNEPQDVFLEGFIESIRKTELKNTEEGTFWIVVYLNDIPHGIRVRGWVPRSIKTIDNDFILEITNQSYLVFIANLDAGKFESSDSKNVKMIPFDINGVFSKTFDFNKTKRKAINIGIVCAFFVMFGFGLHHFTSSNNTMTFNLPVKTETKKIDTFIGFRQAQAAFTTAGRVLYALEPTYTMIRNGALPTGWVNKKITYENDSLNASVISMGKGVAEIGALKGIYNNHINRSFMNIDGQNVNVTVPISSDGAAFSNKSSSLSLEELRDNVIDTMSLLNASEVLSNKYEMHDHYKIQKMKVVFKKVSPLTIGLLSRAFANKPIYLETLELTQNDRTINLELTLVFIEVSSEKPTEATE